MDFNFLLNIAFSKVETNVNSFGLPLEFLEFQEFQEFQELQEFQEIQNIPINLLIILKNHLNFDFHDLKCQKINNSYFLIIKHDKIYAQNICGNWYVIIYSDIKYCVHNIYLKNNEIIKTNVVINNEIIKTIFLDIKITWKENKIYEIYNDKMSILLTFSENNCMVEYYEDINETSKRHFIL